MSKFLRVQRSNYSRYPITEKCKPLETGIISCLRDGTTKYFDFAVIGSGVAGLRYALEVSKHGTVAVITKAEPHESNTNYAQGGVSAVLCPLDSVESHMRDTIVAGAYLCDEETVRVSFKTNSSSSLSLRPSMRSVVFSKFHANFFEMFVKHLQESNLCMRSSIRRQTKKRCPNNG